MTTTRDLSVTVGTAATSSTPIPMADMRSGVVYVSGLTAATTITLYASVDGMTFSPLHETSGAAVTMAIPAAAAAVVLPVAASPVRFLKLVSGIDLGAATIVVSLKN
jgi:hypothetical protein